MAALSLQVVERVHFQRLEKAQTIFQRLFVSTIAFVQSSNSFEFLAATRIFISTRLVVYGIAYRRTVYRQRNHVLQRLIVGLVLLSLVVNVNLLLYHATCSTQKTLVLMGMIG